MVYTTLNIHVIFRKFDEWKFECAADSSNRVSVKFLRSCNNMFIFNDRKLLQEPEDYIKSVQIDRSLLLIGQRLTCVYKEENNNKSKMKPYCNNIQINTSTGLATKSVNLLLKHSK